MTVSNCSFCGSKKDEVKDLIVAIDNVAICDECVMNCLDILVYGPPELKFDSVETDKNKTSNELDETETAAGPGFR